MGRKISGFHDLLTASINSEVEKSILRNLKSQAESTVEAVIAIVVVHSW